MKLTDRQLQIALLWADCYSKEGIGLMLGVTPKTVAAHINNIYETLGIGTRAALIWWAIGHGFFADRFNVKPAAPAPGGDRLRQIVTDYDEVMARLPKPVMPVPANPKTCHRVTFSSIR